LEWKPTADTDFLTRMFNLTEPIRIQLGKRIHAVLEEKDPSQLHYVQKRAMDENVYYLQSIDWSHTVLFEKKDDKKEIEFLLVQ